MTRLPRVFISRTTAGLAALTKRVAEVLRQRGIEPRSSRPASTRPRMTIKGMLAKHLQQCDTVISSYIRKMDSECYSRSGDL